MYTHYYLEMLIVDEPMSIEPQKETQLDHPVVAVVAATVDNNIHFQFQEETRTSSSNAP